MQILLVILMICFIFCIFMMIRVNLIFSIRQKILDDVSDEAQKLIHKGDFGWRNKTYVVFHKWRSFDNCLFAFHKWTYKQFRNELKIG